MIERLLLFGATGDLAGRFLLPALAELHDEGKLPDGFRVVGAAREDWDDEAFRRHAARRLDQLFITTSREGLEPGADPLAGSLFRATVGVRGLPVREFAG